MMSICEAGSLIRGAVTIRRRPETPPPTRSRRYLGANSYLFVEPVGELSVPFMPAPVVNGAFATDCIARACPLNAESCMSC
jgi:hypothetical protein